MVNSGRNAGSVGTVKYSSEDVCYVCFDIEVVINEGFGSYGRYEDAYWVNTKNLEKIS